MISTPLSITFSNTLVQDWWKDFQSNTQRKTHLRVGQDFFNEFNCHKVQGPDRPFLDRLYNLDGHDALNAIHKITDFTQ
jgi:hypothetical protein